MHLIIRRENGMTHYYKVYRVEVNEKREVTEASTDFDYKRHVNLRLYAGCDATLVVGNRNELVTIVKEIEYGEAEN